MEPSLLALFNKLLVNNNEDCGGLLSSLDDYDKMLFMLKIFDKNMET